MHDRPIIIKEISDGLCVDGPGLIWRAYGINKKGKEFQLPDNRYDTLYPLDASTEKQLRTLIKRQYPNHPIQKESKDE